MYMVTVITAIDDGGIEEFVGWFSKRKKAIRHVINNNSDINETMFDYALVQYMPEGFYQISPDKMWFKFNYDTKKYEMLCERCNPEYDKK